MQQDPSINLALGQNQNTFGLDMEQYEKWKRETVSGALLARLEEMGKRDGKRAGVLNWSKPLEIFCYGEEKATLKKKLEGAMVGGEAGQIKDLVECYHYKRLPWWREALEAEQIEFNFSELPVAFAARDVVAEWRETFIPEDIINKYNLSEPSKSQVNTELIDWINTEIINTLSPLVNSDYKPELIGSVVRLIPLTAEAAQSRTEDNEVYAKLLEKIKAVAELLKQRWQAKALGQV